MIVFGRQALGAARRRPIVVEGHTFHKSEWLEAGTDPRLSPTVFLAEQPPDYALVPHFHRQNQFQLFVEGTGTLGRTTTVGPGTVHYAGAYTGYGPLVSGAEGLKYFTIRAVFDTGYIAARDARDKMVRGPKRHAAGSAGSPGEAAALAALDRPQMETVLPAAEDGLGATTWRLPPGASVAPAPVDGSIGQFLFVLAGSLSCGAQALGRWECLFATPDERLPALVAGDGGAHVVTLSVPRTEPVYQAAAVAA